MATRYQLGLLRQAGSVTVPLSALALRIHANQVALLAELGDVDGAQHHGRLVERAARQYGFAEPEMMAGATLAGLTASGAERASLVGVLESLARVVALQELHAQLVAEAGVPHDVTRSELDDSGVIEQLLANQAKEHHDTELAIA